jgi:uncharacterized protein YkwD
MPHRFRLPAASALVCLALLASAAPSSAGTLNAAFAPAQGAVRGQTAVGSDVERAPVRARVAQECANQDVAPTRGNERLVRAAILCLHNQIRAQRGLPALRENARLRKAAVGHSSNMVSRRFFEHTTPAGATMVDRIRAARYVPRNAAWALGENLAWGTGSLATPRGIMRAWMNSPGHKANIVKRAYREIGIGVVVGIPSGESEGATYTADFGMVRR